MENQICQRIQLENEKLEKEEEEEIVLQMN